MIRSTDDLRVFLAVARTGRLVQAGALLGVDHTTVGRRISALERTAGRRLFDRRSEGWELTPDGERLLGPAEAVDAALASAHEALESGERTLTGTVRILATDGFGAFLVPPVLRTLRERHPGLVVELVTETQHIGSSVRDFDVAVTLEEPASSRLVHRRLADYVLRLYATPEYLERHPPVGTVEDLRAHTLIWYVDRLLNVEPLRVLHEVRPTAANIQSTNVVAHWQAAAAGAGIALLPCYIAEEDPRLTQVLPDLEVRRTYWISSPAEHARLARVRAVVGLIDEAMRRSRSRLIGGVH
ncbi:LysR family transcriptional regulator [Ruania alkalisoli]|uniref:LysR family transcriptional regulator n=1 Tax=Ruania alkalisoli TaxID=2779775 RepID=A0A7M1SVM6_9MICO|nr:LysR family transcriptional regulator [Ruania alkalisoli]QOR71630.1 LysR family transcriptional regulator [Ruania alkalisoli]